MLLSSYRPDGCFQRLTFFFFNLPSLCSHVRIFKSTCQISKPNFSWHIYIKCTTNCGPKSKTPSILGDKGRVFPENGRQLLPQGVVLTAPKELHFYYKECFWKIPVKRIMYTETYFPYTFITGLLVPLEKIITLIQIQTCEIAAYF